MHHRIHAPVHQESDFQLKHIDGPVHVEQQHHIYHTCIYFLYGSALLHNDASADVRTGNQGDHRQKDQFLLPEVSRGIRIRVLDVFLGGIRQDGIPEGAGQGHGLG